MRLPAIVAVVSLLSGCALFGEAEPIDRLPDASASMDAGLEDANVDEPDVSTDMDADQEDATLPVDTGIDAGPADDARLQTWNPLIHISFDSAENGGFEILSDVINRDCVIDGDVSVTPGLVGNAATFTDGNCWVAHEPGWEIPSGTIVMWIRPDFDSSAKAFLSKGANNGTGFNFFDAGGFFTVNVKEGEGTGHSVGPMLVANEWVMLAVTWSDAGFSMWIDAERRATHDTILPWVGNEEFLTFGVDSTVSAPGERTPAYNAFTGQIDDVWVFDRELTNIELLDFQAQTEAVADVL